MSKKPTYEQLERRIRKLERNIHKLGKLDEEKIKFEAELQKDFAASIAHDFNNLFMAIQGNISLMLIDVEPSDPLHERLVNIEKHIRSGTRLTSHLLIQAKEERYEVKTINLNKLIENTSETSCKKHKEVIIEQNLNPSIYLVKANISQIEQMLFNLCVYVSNKKHCSGKLILKTSNVTDEKIKGKKYTPKKGNYVLLTITDPGRVLSQNTMEFIFEPLINVTQKYYDSNLGLASVYGTVKSYGGYIDVESDRKNGTSFHIYIPATDQKITTDEHGVISTEDKAQTILLVDDEKEILEISGEMLEKLGYNILIAKDGKEAVDIYNDCKDEIELVILDVVMPGMSGGETYDLLKNTDPYVKVLLSSGYSLDGEASKILDKGCEGFIQKPFNMREISDKIIEIIG